jgi:hypothetical protein
MSKTAIRKIDGRIDGAPLCGRVAIDIIEPCKWVHNKLGRRKSFWNQTRWRRSDDVSSPSPDSGLPANYLNIQPAFLHLPRGTRDVWLFRGGKYEATRAGVTERLVALSSIPQEFGGVVPSPVGNAKVPAWKMQSNVSQEVQQVIALTCVVDDIVSRRGFMGVIFFFLVSLTKSTVNVAAHPNPQIANPLPQYSRHEQQHI